MFGLVGVSHREFGDRFIEVAVVAHVAGERHGVP